MLTIAPVSRCVTIPELCDASFRILTDVPLITPVDPDNEVCAWVFEFVVIGVAAAAFVAVFADVSPDLLDLTSESLTLILLFVLETRSERI